MDRLMQPHEVRFAVRHLLLVILLRDQVRYAVPGFVDYYSLSNSFVMIRVCQTTLILFLS